MADTIRILVATDNHVGAHERNPVRCDDSWKTFHEIMCLARKKEVDMVLLAGDLFHENKPSRKAMYNVMRSLRMNCLGPRPCELEMLSDGSEHFDPTFDSVNYEDQDINVSIPVFSIHGNHDDPTGDGHFTALDLLSVSGLLNYFGRTPESDKIAIKPILLQKGRTKLALYGMSNVRDERLFRTFRDKNVRFFQPGTQLTDWYNIICLHQNHHAHTETSYLPENYLPNFLDLVIWGHEHECDIEPHMNPEMNFRVMQPGSSIATSLIPGEAVPKHVALLTITGREMKSEPIRLKTVRPFIYKDLILSTDKEAVKIARKEEHRTELTRHLINIVEKMIAQAKNEWEEAQADYPASDDEDNPTEFPLPLIRLRVETTLPDGLGKFDVENAQRFSNRFIAKVANTNDVVQFHTRKKAAAAARAARDADKDKDIMAKVEALDEIGVHQLVQEFLEAQALTILPQNYFSEAVNQYVRKDDKHAMELFVTEALTEQTKELVRLQIEDDEEEEDEENLATRIQEIRAKIEEDFTRGKLKVKSSKGRLKPKPAGWDSDLDGEWEAQPAALVRSDEENNGLSDDDDDDDATPAPRAVTARGRGRGRGGRGASTSTRGKKPATAVAAATSRATTATTARGRKKPAKQEFSDDEDEDDDVVMVDDDDDEDDDDEGQDDSQAMFFTDNKKKPNGKATSSGTKARGKTTAATAASASATNGSSSRGTARQQPTTAGLIKKPPARAAASKAKQSTLAFTKSQQSILGNGFGGGSRSQSVNDDIDDDDDDEDAFEPVVSSGRKR